MLSSLNWSVAVRICYMYIVMSVNQKILTYPTITHVPPL